MEDGSFRKLDAVEKVRACMEKFGVREGIVHSGATIFTVEDASIAVGVPPAEILKSLLFSVNDGESWALALMSGPNKVHDKKIKRALGARKVSMGSADAIFDFCGFKPGGVPPIGYETQPATLLDDDLFQYAAVWSAAGTDHDFFPIDPHELMRITNGVRCDIKK